MKYRKPYSIKKHKKFYQSSWFWLAFLGLSLALGITYLLLFLPNIQITHLEISGNQKVATQDIEALVQKEIDQRIIGFSSKSIFLVNSKTISQKLLAGFPSLESAEVKKGYFSKLTIYITERKPFAIFCKTGSDCFSIDKNGIIFQLTDSSPKNMMVLSHDPADVKKLEFGQTVIAKNIMEGIINIQDDLKKNFQIDIKEIMVSNPLIITTFENWKVYIDPLADINLQIAKMRKLLTDEISPSARKKLQYIYLQYQDRAYFK